MFHPVKEVWIRNPLSHQRFPTRLCDDSNVVVQSAGDNVAEEILGENREVITESASLRAVTALGTVVRSAHANLSKHRKICGAKEADKLRPKR